MAKAINIVMLCVALFVFISLCLAAKKKKNKDDSDSGEESAAEKWKKKDLRDYNDGDMERLFMQWEEDEETDPDDLMEHERPAPKIDFSKIDPKNPETVLQLSKKGKTLMMFVTISGEPTQEESEEITQRWQDQLFQANYQLQRYMVDSNRAIFLLKDGALAWELKNFLTQQDRCQEVTIDNKSYYGKGSGLKTNEQGDLLEGEKDGKAKKSKEKKGKNNKKDNTVQDNVKVVNAKREKKVKDNKTEL